jgi:hypothetical protein
MRYSRRLISVKGLKEFLKNYSDDAFIVVGAFDHSYRTPVVYGGKAIMHSGDLLDELGFVEEKDLKKGEKIVDIVVIE